MESQKVFTTNEYGEKLVGLVDCLRPQKDKFPTVILVHGFAVEKTEGGMFNDIAHSLAKNDFLIYRFDFSGAGESEGDYWKTSVAKLSEDLRSIIDFVKAQPKVDSSKIVLVGMSLGVVVSILLNAPEIRAYVLLGSVARLYKGLIHPSSSPFSLHSPSGVGLFDRFLLFIRVQTWRDVFRNDVIKAVGEINKPICFIHGEKDTKIPLSEAKALYKAANEPKKLVIIKGARHGFYEPDERKQMIRETINWFQNHLS